MNERKQFALVVAKIDWPAPKQLVAVHVPWDQFGAKGVADEYAALVARTGAEPVIVSRSPEGRWESATAVDDVWRRICESTPIESHRWHTMKVEADHYPWEVPGK